MPDYLVATAQAAVYHVSPGADPADDTRATLLWQGHHAPVHALAAHPSADVIAVGRSGPDLRVVMYNVCLCMFLYVCLCFVLMSVYTLINT